ncbi:MAG: cbb3-type cytochrome c oxidase subunit I, partial [Candidatus Eremiobacteraeota bacterium]|nr:cbb3-type cytochrome c oxidase subunit I [Candidatus Eremiobacteraeota bacterium]
MTARLCPVTNLTVNSSSERLLRWNAVVAVVFLLVGAVAALLLALTRWQAVHLLEPIWYYRILTLHGLNMLIFFILFFEMAVLYFAGPILLGARQPAPKLAWTGFALMLGGALMTDFTVLWGRADVLFTSYVPLKAHPLYYLGIILFAVGAFIPVGLFFASLVVAKREKTYEGSVPL